MNVRPLGECVVAGTLWLVASHLQASETSEMPLAPPVCSLDEGFANVPGLGANGWVVQNNSSPLGATTWSQGSSAMFVAAGGSASSYIAVTYQSAGYGNATIGNWLLTPPLTLQNGASFSFWSRTFSPVQYPDRLQVRLSTNGSSTNVGTTTTSVGDFTTVLLDINPTYSSTGFPTSWTSYAATISGLSMPMTGRLGFRYFVEQGGPTGTNSDYIGIDSVKYDCNGVPTPTPIPTATPPTGTACFVAQAFGNVNTLSADGWFMQNNSNPLGNAGWFQGNTATFTANAGSPNSYVAASRENGAGSATISNWLLLPPLSFFQGGMVFATRTVATPTSPDRLQVRLSTNAFSTNVGSSAADVGDFATLLLDINPTYSLTGYPTSWTTYFVSTGGMSGGRLAFRYFVENGGPGGTRSDNIGIDSVVYSCAADSLPIVNVSGTVRYCSNPSQDPVSRVTMLMTGFGGPPRFTNIAGGYYLSYPVEQTNAPVGYLVTPGKPALPPSTLGINTTDVLGCQRHFLNIAPLPAGCRRTAGDVTGDAIIDTTDVIAIQRFYLGIPTGIANTGKYQFSPVNRIYFAGDYADQDYDALVFGDVAPAYIH